MSNVDNVKSEKERNAVGYFVWVWGMRGPTCEKWDKDKLSHFPESKKRREALTIQREPLDPEEFEYMTLKQLAEKYPLKQPIPVRPSVLYGE